MGDASGNFYRLEGSGTAGDAGQVSIATEWQTRLYSVPLDAEMHDVEGYIKYHKSNAASVRIVFEYAGHTAFDHAITVTIPALSGANHFGGDYYFGGEFYFGVAFDGRLIRQPIQVPGQASDFQTRLFIEGTSEFRINEIGLRFRASSQ